VIVWLWDAGSALGVTDDEARARKTVTAFMQNNKVDSARLESATLATGVRTLTTVYRRTGIGWSGRRYGSQITWRRLPQMQLTLMSWTR
jgi:hypothetical protein